MNDPDLGLRPAADGHSYSTHFHGDVLGPVAWGNNGDITQNVIPGAEACRTRLAETYTTGRCRAHATHDLRVAPHRWPSQPEASTLRGQGRDQGSRGSYEPILT